MADAELRVNEFTQEVDRLDSELSQINERNQDQRWENIMDALKNDTLQVQEISENELLLLHSKLHNLWQNKNCRIPMERVVKYHILVKVRIPTHTEYDSLDFI